MSLEGTVRRREMLKMTGAVAGGAVLGIGGYAGGERLYRSAEKGGGPPPEQAQVPSSPETRNATRTDGSALTSRPNDGTGYWPDSSNTGYKHAPGYTGSLAAGPSTITSGSTYSHMSFHGCDVGRPFAHVDNVTFIGCLFWGINPGVALVKCNGNNITFRYCSFMPVNEGDPFYASYNESYQYAVLYDGDEGGMAAGQLTMDWCDVWGFGNGLQLNGSTRQAPHSITNCWFHHGADTDAAPGGSTGLYHVDAILCTVGGARETYLAISGNSLASLGSTNAIALQRDSGDYYHYITITNNYLSGFGYTVQIGGDGRGNSHITFTDNIWSTGIEAKFGPLYSWGGSSNVWRHNRWQVFSGDPANPVKLTADATGKYWWPTDTNAHSEDYTGG
jgi:hypothetical protein